MKGKADLLKIECEKVTREGYIVVRGKKYLEDGGVFYINGKYYNSGTSIDNWVTPSYTIRKDYDGDYFVSSTKEKSVNAGESVDTIYWIENGKVTIDGNEYFFDKDEMTVSGTGALKYFEDGVSLSAKEVTDCESIEFYPFEKSKDFINVTKFRLEKSEDREFEVENVTFINHFFYAFYNEKYCPIEINSSGKYVCKIDGTYHNVVQLGEDGAIRHLYAVGIDKQIVLGVVILQQVFHLLIHALRNLVLIEDVFQGIEVALTGSQRVGICSWHALRKGMAGCKHQDGYRENLV
jgi:uncharacterized protein (UPF0248 family)